MRNKQAQQKQTPRYRELAGGCRMGGELGVGGGGRGVRGGKAQTHPDSAVTGMESPAQGTESAML